MSAESVRWALLSVSDKRHIDTFARGLVQQGYGLLSTGGTALALREAGLEVRDVAEHTGASEMMGGRVKTLHPNVHGGILGRRGEDDAVMAERGIDPIDIVCVNLYPFAAAVADPDCTLEHAIENIDIGGPAMVRSAAKNHASVLVVTDPDDYTRVLEALSSKSLPTLSALRRDLAVKAFEHTAHYDGMIADWLGRLQAEDTVQPSARFPRTWNRQYRLHDTLRYGENPHQQAAFYHEHEPVPGTLAAATFVQGKALSYNNLVDADAALGCVSAFAETACVIVKHANPCGAALDKTPLAAYRRAYDTDPTSAFGGIIAFNRAVDGACMTAILDQQFVEVIIAPRFEAAAVAALESSPNVRALEVGTFPPRQIRLQSRTLSGGMLVQEDDVLDEDPEQWTVVSRRAPSDQERADLAFAWRVASWVKSNAIVYARDAQTVGVGAGQMSRVYSARIAAIKAADAELATAGSVMASDAFFPFRDGLDSAAEAGIRAVVQPGGSRNDAEVIAAADEHGIAMLFTGTRHFRH